MKKNITLKGRTFGFTYEEDSDIEMLAMPDENGVSCFTIIFKWKKPCFPKKISLEWDIPAINVYYMWDALEKVRLQTDDILCPTSPAQRSHAWRTVCRLKAWLPKKAGTFARLRCPT